jgi:hypothetical protein
LEAVADRSGWKIVKVYEDCAVRIYANAASIIQLGGVVVPVLSGSEQYSSAPDKRPTPIAELTGYSCRKGAV